VKVKLTVGKHWQSVLPSHVHHQYIPAKQVTTMIRKVKVKVWEFPTTYIQLLLQCISLFGHTAQMADEPQRS